VTCTLPPINYLTKKQSVYLNFRPNNPIHDQLYPRFNTNNFEYQNSRNVEHAQTCKTDCAHHKCHIFKFPPFLSTIKFFYMKLPKTSEYERQNISMINEVCIKAPNKTCNSKFNSTGHGLFWMWFYSFYPATNRSMLPLKTHWSNKELRDLHCKQKVTGDSMLTRYHNLNSLVRMTDRFCTGNRVFDYLYLSV